MNIFLTRHNYKREKNSVWFLKKIIYSAIVNEVSKYFIHSCCFLVRVYIKCYENSQSTPKTIIKIKLFTSTERRILNAIKGWLEKYERGGKTFFRRIFRAKPSTSFQSNFLEIFSLVLDACVCEISQTFSVILKGK